MLKELIAMSILFIVFIWVENIDKIQYCDQQSALLQQLWLQFETGVR